MEAQRLAFEADGAVHYPGAVEPQSAAALAELLDTALLDPSGKPLPGKRLIGHDWRGLLTANGKLGCIAAHLIGDDVQPVRAVVFDKTPVTNWSVAWHQDRTVAVQRRIETDGFGPWSTKDGILHVAPPISVLAGMVTLRLHLDDCGGDNAPLKVALGSHRLGFVAADMVADIARILPERICYAAVGDVWAYSTLILHASERSRAAGRRRVLQVDFAAGALPGGLELKGL